MKRNWLTAFVGTMLWGVGGLFAAGGVAPARASDPAYCVCPYFAEDFSNSYAYGSDWYLLGPESQDADAFLAALDAAEAEAEEANKAKTPKQEAVPSPLPLEKANCLIDKSTGENYARYLVEQVYKLYFADKTSGVANDQIVADPSDDATLLSPAEQDYLDWRLDALGSYEPAYADEPVSEALASEASQKIERLELKPAPQAKYDWEAYEYDWCGADDPAFASQEEKPAVASQGDKPAITKSQPAKKSVKTTSAAEKSYAQAERLSAFEEYAIWEQNYGDCAEAAEAWAAVQNLEDEFANYWDNVVLSGEKYVAPAKNVGSISTIVLNGSPSACTPTVKATLVRDEDFAAPGQYVAIVREEESYPLDILTVYGRKLNLSDEAVARIATSRVREATELSTLNVATQPFLAFGETARRAIRDLVLSSDERAALRQVASQSKSGVLR
jgi:hypothetical protein